MEKRMIRCVSIRPDKKTGEYAVKFLSENVVNNRFFMKKYGWRVEEVKEEVKETKKIAPIEIAIDLAPDRELLEEAKREAAKTPVVEEFAEVPAVEFIEAPAIEAPKTEAPIKPKATRAKRKTTKK